MELVSACPMHDTLAIFMLLNALLHYVARLLWFDLGPWTHVLIALPSIALLSRLTAVPEPSVAEPRAIKRSPRLRPPPIWAAVARLWLFILGEVPLVGKSHQRRKGAWVAEKAPQVRYVGETQVGLLLHEPSLVRFVVNGLPWTQVYSNDETHMAVLYGLCPGTIYEAAAVPLDRTPVLEFTFCTALLSPSDQKPRKLATPIHDIALESAKETLASERAQVRKFRRESVKRLAAIRHDTEAMTHKVAVKRQTDERAQKRIAALEERISQLANEIADIEGAVDGAHANISELANEAQGVMLERQSKQQDLDVSVRVWAELLSSKQNDVQKLRQRCDKLQERVKRLDRELVQQASGREREVDAYIAHIREQRKARKNRRVRLESEFVQAIQKLDSE